MKKNSDMWFLAERLVLAVETMSQDVKNMSAYVYDLNYSVSRFLDNINKDKVIPVVPCDESGSFPCDLPPSADDEYSLQCGQKSGSSVSEIGDMENEEMSVQHVGCKTNSPVKNADDLTSFTPGINTEELFKSAVKRRGRNRVKNSTAHRTRLPEGQYTVLETLKPVRAYESKGNSVQNNSEESHKTNGRILRSYSNCGEYPVQSHKDTVGAILYSKKEITVHGVEEKEYQMESTATGQSHLTAKEKTQTCKRKTRSSLSKKTTVNKGRSQKREKISFCCDICGKNILYKWGLEAHKRRHTGEKPFQCAHCKKAVATKGELIVHLRVHTQERPYKCSFCDKTFKTCSTVNAHMRQHRGVKPFICKECGKAFASGSHLTTHMRTHTGEKPFKCAECGFEFSQKGHLTKHMGVHTGKRSCVCVDCGSCFAEKGSLQRHRRRAHGVALSVRFDTA